MEYIKSKLSDDLAKKSIGSQNEMIDEIIKDLT